MQLGVVAQGMVTPLGESAAACCAAIRAGLMRFVELDSSPLSDGQRVVVSTTGVKQTGADRLIALLRGALSDLASHSAEIDGDRAAAILALPARGGIDEAEFLALVSRAFDAPAVFKRTIIVCADETGVLSALAELAPAVASGVITRVLVAAVDSLVEPDSLRALHQAERLKTKDRFDGMIPGEAAVALLLEPGGAVCLSSPAVEQERELAYDDVADGRALSAAMRKTLGAEQTVRLLVSDMNGEIARAEELSYATGRVMQGDFSIWHPADSVGACGAAATALNVAVAARGIQQGYARSDAVLITASGGRQRGTVLVRAVAGATGPEG